MFIRSQDGLNLVNVDQIQGIAADSLPYDVSITADGILLGTYDTCDKAIKVLDRIQNGMERTQQGFVYEMPKDGEV